jgi:hypothetical protein
MNYRKVGDVTNHNLFMAAMAGIGFPVGERREAPNKAHGGRRGEQRERHRGAQVAARRARRSVARATRQQQRRRHG